MGAAFPQQAKGEAATRKAVRLNPLVLPKRKEEVGSKPLHRGRASRRSPMGAGGFSVRRQWGRREANGQWWNSGAWGGSARMGHDGQGWVQVADTHGTEGWPHRD